MASPDDTDITVLGPANSGKNWLFRGFAKELEEYTLRSKDFIFDLVKTSKSNHNFNKVLVDLPDNIYNASIEEDYVYAFSRKIKSVNEFEHYKTSTFAHYINFHNIRDEDLIAALLDPSRFTPPYASIVKSKFTLLLLDSTLVKGNSVLDTEIAKVDDHPEFALQPSFVDSYCQVLNMLLKAMAEDNDHEKYLAVCITKTDTLGFTNSNSWKLLERVFGHKIFELFNYYRDIFRIEIFATSAVGYTIVKGSAVSNYSNGKIIDPIGWSPLNCAAPFFWLFENREIERIKSASNFLSREANLRNYKRYPTH